MMTELSCEVIRRLQGKSLATAESITGGGIGSALTSVSGSSAVYKGGVISYTNQVKQQILRVPGEMLDSCGAVSAPVAQAMAEGVRKLLSTDAAVSVTGLAGPGGDDFGNPVGTVFVGYCDEQISCVRKCLFSGSREEVRAQTIETALNLILEYNK